MTSLLPGRTNSSSVLIHRDQLGKYPMTLKTFKITFRRDLILDLTPGATVKFQPGFYGIEKYSITQ